MITKFIDFFKRSYKTDRVAFYVELLETVILITASATLSFTILDPATEIFIPLYLMGSILAMISTYRRGSSALLLCTWFTVMNGWAFAQLFLI